MNGEKEREKMNHCLQEKQKVVAGRKCNRLAPWSID